jgi:hypothetical protein
MLVIKRVSLAKDVHFPIPAAILLAIASGCFSSNGMNSPLSLGQVDQFARTQDPSELMERIMLGEKACGGKEAQSLLRAAYWLKRGDYANSLIQIAKVSPEGPHRRTSIWLAAEALYRSGNLAQAMRMLSSLVAEHPDDLEAVFIKHARVMKRDSYAEVLQRGLGEGRAAAGGVDILQPQQEAPAGPRREQRRMGVAQVQVAGGAGREAGYDALHGPDVRRQGRRSKHR